MQDEQDDNHLLLGIPEIDRAHREFLDLLTQIRSADKAGFIALYAALETHTQAHFDAEHALMQASGFPATRDHSDEHLRVLGEMRRIGERVRRGSLAMARAYVREQLPAWFALHATTMDGALAAHLH